MGNEGRKEGRKEGRREGRIPEIHVYSLLSLSGWTKIGISQALVSRFDYLLYCKQTKELQKRRNRENCGFTKLAFSPPFRVRLTKVTLL